MHPLSWSTFYGQFEIIELLLKHGADVGADFDPGGGETATVLDVVEKILLGSEDTRRKGDSSRRGTFWSRTVP